MKISGLVILGVIVLLSCGAKMPSDTELFSQAQEHESKQEFNQAIEKYDSIIENFPESPMRYKAFFMKGFILFEKLKDNQKAVEAFDMLISEYPDCDLADDAEVLRDIALQGGDIMSVFEDSLIQE